MLCPTMVCTGCSRILRTGPGCRPIKSTARARGCQDDRFPEVEVPKHVFIPGFAKEGVLHHPQDIDHPEDDADKAQNGDDRVRP